MILSRRIWERFALGRGGYNLRVFPEKERSDILQRLVLPVLGTVVAIVSILKDYPQVAFLALAVVALALLSTYGRWILERMRGFVHRRQDERLLRSELPTLATYVCDFERFLTLQGNAPNPYMILFKAAQTSAKPPFNFDQLKLVHPVVLSGFLAGLMKRCKGDGVAGREVRDNLEEFATILQSFYTSQLLTIYGNQAGAVRASITDETKSELNAARDEYAYFLRRYQEFVRTLNSRLHDKVPPWLPDPPNPL